MTKKQINIRLHQWQINAIHDYCKKHERQTRNSIIEDGLELIFAQLRIEKPKNEPVYFDGDVEDMPGV